ncbi:MAG: molybdenum cofactor guanylyltransferase [Marinilabiliales bacterium]|nr:MAG: molybdenum cofactor guanylyltransferase [Marinilabiliales bacterium]
MEQKREISGIILSGGKSSRMGSEKGMKIFNGKPLIEYAIEALGISCKNIIISTNNPEFYEKYNIPLIKDEIKNIGPMGGIYSCLRQSNTEYNLVLSCDMPFIDKELISYLINAISSDYTAVVPVHDENKLEPLCAVYSRTSLITIEKQIWKEDYKLMNLLNEINVKKLIIDEWDRFDMNYFRNFNSPKDLINSSI